jgi:hypothetical protein
MLPAAAGLSASTRAAATGVQRRWPLSVRSRRSPRRDGDRVIARLLADGRRTTDIADVLGVSRAWVAGAVDRVRDSGS